MGQADNTEDKGVNYVLERNEHEGENRTGQGGKDIGGLDLLGEDDQGKTAQEGRHLGCEGRSWTHQEEECSRQREEPVQRGMGRCDSPRGLCSADSSRFFSQ